MESRRGGRGEAGEEMESIKRIMSECERARINDWHEILQKIEEAGEECGAAEMERQKVLVTGYSWLIKQANHLIWPRGQLKADKLTSGGFTGVGFRRGLPLTGSGATFGQLLP